MKWQLFRISENSACSSAQLVARLSAWFGTDVRLFEGYALVRTDMRRTDTPPDLEGPVMMSGRPVEVSGKEVERLLQGLPVRRGETIRIKTGDFRGLRARVEHVSTKSVSVRVRLRSIQPLLILPREGVAYE